MMSRKMKSLFYSVSGPVMKVNGSLYKALRAPKSGKVRAHLGPGQQHYLDGWVNIDANTFTGKCDVWANLIDGIPMRDASVDAIYSHHVIEHLPDLNAHFREMYRCLKPGGVFRVGGPNGDMAIRKYVEGDADWFDGFPDARESIGGKFENFIFCRQEHLTILTPSYLEEVAHRAGFVDLRQVHPCRETSYPEVFDAQVMGVEWEPTPETPHTLLMEGRKPG